MATCAATNHQDFNRSKRLTVFTSLATASLLLALAGGCGKDDKDFKDIDGEVGPVPGNFNARLASDYRKDVDSLQDKLESAIPGLGAKLDQRFGKSDAAAGGGTKLSDLLKIELPGTESEAINSRIMEQLVSFEGKKGAYFNVVDTEKYLKSPAYEPTAASGDDAKYQYYLEMIRWQEAVEPFTPATMTNTAPVVVAVLDTGVLAKHEDLKNVMWTNDKGSVGYDASSGDEMGPSTSTDAHGHGTHVAGIIGAQGDNTVGINGVGFVSGRDGDAKKSITEIMAVKVMNDHGAGTSDMVNKGLKWAVDQHRKQKSDNQKRSQQKLIINMSLGGPFETSGYSYKTKGDGSYDFQDDIINYATLNGDVLIVVAAGNESCGIGGACDVFDHSYKETYYYPCSYANVLCVAATSPKDTLAGFSNRAASVGIAAPGFDIISTLADATDAYGYMSGTSMATPVTAGAAAVLWYKYPEFSATEIKALLQKSAAQISDITGEISSGDGRLDLKAALAFAEQVKTAGKPVAEVTPAAGLVQTSKIKPEADSVPDSGHDPDAKSENATGASSGGGSSGGCGVIGTGSGDKGWFAFFILGLMALIPVFKRQRKIN